MTLVLRIVLNAIALAVAAWLLDGITVGNGSTGQQIVTLLIVGAIFGLVNAIVRPIVKLLSLPFILLTLGLLIFVINALMLLLTSWLSGKLGVDFHVDGFVTALIGAIIVSIASWVLDLVVPGDR